MQDDTLDHDPGDRVAPTPPFAPGTTVGHFRVVSELGAGGMGVVFEAHDPDLDRRVAIKVVRDRDAGSAAGARLIREAQAMARLAHPNVVAVYEVGTIEAQVFLVMELVRGATLASWLDTPRPWRDVITSFVQAGEGLAAAHHAGLVHRDFKPSNVLVDGAGRVRVGDFGLARDDDRPRFAIGSERAAGTPAYMAPEQRAGDPVDARADQYAFAVSLQQALSPRRALGTPPRRIRAAIVRALAIDPDARFRTMDDLLHELRRGLASRRRTAIAIAATIALSGAAAGATAWLMRAPADDCGDGAHLVDALWNPVIRDAQAARFAAARPSATTAIATTARMLDDWADGWRLGRRAACRAEPTPRTARLACLDGELGELRAQLAAWNHAEPQLVDRAVSAAAALPPPSACDSRTTGKAPSWVTRAIIDRAAEINASNRAGHAARVKPELPALLEAANATSDPQARAAANVAAGSIAYSSGDVEGARARFASAAVDAGRAGDDVMLFEALRSEAIAVTDLGRPLDSLGMLDAADAVAARTGLDRGWEIATVRGNSLVEAGRLADGIAELGRAVAMLEPRAARDPASDIQLATAIGMMAAAHAQANEFDQARTLALRALAIDERELGPMHPELAKALGDLAETESNLGKLDDAAAHIERARAIFVAAYGPDHMLVAQTDASLAHIADRAGHPDEAIALFERAREGLAKTMAPDKLVFASIETGIAAVERDRDHFPEAIIHLERGLAILERRSPGGAQHGSQLVVYAECLAQVGRYAEAYPAAAKALTELEQARVAPDQLAEAQVTLADLEGHAGHRARAIEVARAMLAATAQTADPAVKTMRSYEQGQLAKWTK